MPCLCYARINENLGNADSGEARTARRTSDSCSSFDRGAMSICSPKLAMPSELSGRASTLLRAS